MIEKEILLFFIITTIYLLIFMIAEIWRHFKHPETETTRKFVHFTAGIIALSFSYIFKSHWTVMILCLGLCALLFISKKQGFLNSIHRVDRETSGGVFLPIAVYLTFLISSITNMPAFYTIAILVISVSDVLAALVGKAYGKRRYEVETNQYRSIEGSVAFFLSTFLIVNVGILLSTNIGKLECVLLSLLIAIFVTLFESISLSGADNLFIPVSTILFLVRNVALSVDIILYKLFILGFILFLFVVCSYKTKKIGGSGIIGLTLFGYTAWVLLGFEWFLPILIGSVIILRTNLIVRNTDTDDNKLYRIRSVFYVLLTPLIWLFITYFSILFWCKEGLYIFLTPYLICIISQISILWGWKILLNRDKSTSIWMKMTTIYRCILLTIVFTSSYFILFTDLNPNFSILLCIIGTALIDWLYWFIYKKYSVNFFHKNYFKINILVTLVISTIIFSCNLFYYMH